MRFSIITINYNDADGLQATMKSVISQTCSDYEYIVIDGGSTDASVEVIRKHADRLAYWVSEPDGGIYDAMNKGVAHARGEYCIFMNAGDSFYDAQALEHVANAAGADIIVGKVYKIEGGEKAYQPENLSFYFLYSCTIPHQGSVIRTELLRRHPYDTSLKIVSDWKFYLEAVITDNCTVRFIPEPIALFDTHGISSTQVEADRRERDKVLRSMFPERILKDYRHMKESECLTQQLTPDLRRHYTVDRMVYRLGRFLLLLVNLFHHSSPKS